MLINEDSGPTLSSRAAEDPEGPKLAGRMGVSSLMLTVLAFSAPLAVVSGFIPLTLVFGGRGAPFAFIVATVTLLLFSVGYVTMTRRVEKPGAFYAFITTGLGRSVGLGSAFLAIVSYLLILAGTYAFLGITVSSLIESLGGSETPWWLWTVLAWALTSVLGYFNIELSAKVLSVAMVLEVSLVMIFNLAIVFSGGAEGHSITPFLPSEFAKGDVGVTLLFATMVFMGFEATALFRDEVRSPNKTIPHATYGAVLFVGFLYTLSCYTLLTAYGSGAVSVATAAPADMFPDSVSKFVSSSFVQIALVLVTTSIFAALLAIHNVIARYVFNLAADRALPQCLSTVHPRHGSPARSSHVVAALSVAVLAPLTLVGVDAGLLYAQLVGLGSVGVLALMALVSISVIAWFVRQGASFDESVWKTRVAPAVAAIALWAVVILAVIHFELVVGGEPGQYTWFVYILAAFFAVGAGLATYHRSRNPETYERLGRAEPGADPA